MYLITAIIVVIYWIVERSGSRFVSSFTSINKQTLINDQCSDQKDETESLRSLSEQVKQRLTSTGLKFIMDEDEGMIWVMLANDDQYCDCRDIFISIQPDMNIITYQIGIINDLKDEDIISITELCNRLNDRITYGRFVFDYSDATVRLIIYYHLMADMFDINRHQMYFGALLQYKLDIEECFLKVKLNKELPIVAMMGK